MIYSIFSIGVQLKRMAPCRIFLSLRLHFSHIYDIRISVQLLNVTDSSYYLQDYTNQASLMALLLCHLRRAPCVGLERMTFLFVISPPQAGR